MVLDTRGGRFPQPRISVFNTHYPTLEALTAMLKELELPHYVLHRQGQKKGWQPQWGITLSGVKRCIRWCEALLPYSITRRERIAAMLEWCQIRLTQPYHAGEMTPRQRALYEVFSK
jgi:hypothetical protein